MSRRDRRGVSHCVYCGEQAYGERTCTAHRELEELDPALQGERPPATDREQGARDPLAALGRRRRPRR